jgi:hypothetical protein
VQYWMLTRSKFHRGEGSLAEFISDIEQVLRKKIMASRRRNFSMNQEVQRSIFIHVRNGQSVI